MAKRRNPKKEKALRNKAYARQYRKYTNRDRFFGNKSKEQTENKQEIAEGES